MTYLYGPVATAEIEALKKRVAELEAENKELRAALALAAFDEKEEK